MQLKFVQASLFSKSANVYFDDADSLFQFLDAEDKPNSLKAKEDLLKSLGSALMQYGNLPANQTLNVYVKHIFKKNNEYYIAYATGSSTQTGTQSYAATPANIITARYQENYPDIRTSIVSLTEEIAGISSVFKTLTLLTDQIQSIKIQVEEEKARQIAQKQKQTEDAKQQQEEQARSLEKDNTIAKEAKKNEARKALSQRQTAPQIIGNLPNIAKPTKITKENQIAHLDELDKRLPLSGSRKVSDYLHKEKAENKKTKLKANFYARLVNESIDSTFKLKHDQQADTLVLDTSPIYQLADDETLNADTKQSVTTFAQKKISEANIKKLTEEPGGALERANKGHQAYEVKFKDFANHINSQVNAELDYINQRLIRALQLAASDYLAINWSTADEKNLEKNRLENLQEVEQKFGKIIELTPHTEELKNSSYRYREDIFNNDLPTTINLVKEVLNSCNSSRFSNSATCLLWHLAELNKDILVDPTKQVISDYLQDKASEFKKDLKQNKSNITKLNETFKGIAKINNKGDLELNLKFFTAKAVDEFVERISLLLPKLEGQTGKETQLKNNLESIINRAYFDVIPFDIINDIKTKPKLNPNKATWISYSNKLESLNLEKQLEQTQTNIQSAENAANDIENALNDFTISKEDENTLAACRQTLARVQTEVSEYKEWALLAQQYAEYAPKVEEAYKTYLTELNTLDESAQKTEAELAELFSSPAALEAIKKEFEEEKSAMKTRIDAAAQPLKSTREDFARKQLACESKLKDFKGGKPTDDVVALYDNAVTQQTNAIAAIETEKAKLAANEHVRNLKLAKDALGSAQKAVATTKVLNPSVDGTTPLVGMGSQKSLDPSSGSDKTLLNSIQNICEVNSEELANEREKIQKLVVQYAAVTDTSSQLEQATKSEIEKIAASMPNSEKIDEYKQNATAQILAHVLVRAFLALNETAKNKDSDIKNILELIALNNDGLFTLDQAQTFLNNITTHVQELSISNKEKNKDSDKEKVIQIIRALSLPITNAEKIISDLILIPTVPNGREMFLVKREELNRFEPSIANGASVSSFGSSRSDSQPGSAKSSPGSSPKASPKASPVHSNPGGELPNPQVASGNPGGNPPPPPPGGAAPAGQPAAGEQPSFWQRHKKKILIGALIGVLAVAAFCLLATGLFAPLAIIPVTGLAGTVSAAAGGGTLGTIAGWAAIGGGALVGAGAGGALTGGLTAVGCAIADGPGAGAAPAVPAVNPAPQQPPQLPPQQPGTGPKDEDQGPTQSSVAVPGSDRDMQNALQSSPNSSKKKIKTNQAYIAEAPKPVTEAPKSSAEVHLANQYGTQFDHSHDLEQQKQDRLQLFKTKLVSTLRTNGHLNLDEEKLMGSQEAIISHFAQDPQLLEKLRECAREVLDDTRLLSEAIDRIHQEYPWMNNTNVVTNKH